MKKKKKSPTAKPKKQTVKPKKQTDGNAWASAQKKVAEKM
jgi:hypothetical protein